MDSKASLIKPRRNITSRSSSVASPTQLIRRSSPGIKTYSTQFIRPIQNYTSEKDKETISQMKPDFQEILDSVSSFISTNAPTKKIREILKESITDVDKYFTAFYTHLNKSGGNTLSVTRLRGSAKASPQIKSTAVPFIRSWMRFFNSLQKIKVNGLDMIHESIEINFGIILTTLEAVQKGSGYNAGIHDPVVAKSKKLQQQVWEFQSEIDKAYAEVKKKINEEKIVGNLKIFSRELSASFASDFAKFAANGAENERARANAYNALCDIIFQLRGFNTFGEDIDQICWLLENFHATVSIIAENLQLAEILEEMLDEGKDIEVESKPATKARNPKRPPPIPDGQGKAPSPETKEKDKDKEKDKEKDKDKEQKIREKEEDFFSRELPLGDLLVRGQVVIRRSSIHPDKVKQFFDSVQSQISEIQKNAAAQERELKETKQQLIFAESYKERFQEEAEKSAKLRDSLKTANAKIRELETELNMLKANGNLCGLRECIRGQLTQYRTYLGEDLSNKDEELDDTALIAEAQLKLQQVIGRRCPQCEASAKTFKKLEKILGSQLYVEEAQLLTRNAVSAEKNLEKARSEANEERERAISLNQALLRILELFKLTPSAHISLEKFAVQSVQEQVALLNNRFETERDRRLRDAAAIASKIEELFRIRAPVIDFDVDTNVDTITEAIGGQLDQLSKMRASEKTQLTMFENALSEVSRRISLFLRAPPSNKPLIEDVRALLARMDGGESSLLGPLKEALRTIEGEFMEVVSATDELEDCVGRLADNGIPPLPSDTRSTKGVSCYDGPPIGDRIRNVIALLKSF